MYSELELRTCLYELQKFPLNEKSASLVIIFEYFDINMLVSFLGALFQIIHFPFLVVQDISSIYWLWHLLGNCKALDKRVPSNCSGCSFIV